MVMLITIVYMNNILVKTKRSRKDLSKYKGDIVCPHCGGIRINKFGKRGNKQKYICRDCRKVFITEEDSRKKYSEDFKLNALKWYMERVSIRGIERRLGVSDTTIIRWIREKGKIIKNKLLESINNINNNKYNINILEIDELVTYVKKNLKTIEQEEKETIPGYGLLLIGTKIILLNLK